MNFEKKSSTAVRSNRIASDASRAGRQTSGIRIAAGASGRLSTWVRVGGLQALLLTIVGLPAQAQTNETPAVSAPVAPRAGRAAADEVFVASAPEQYTVVRGDTLWGIAGRFLQQPWRWPTIWQMNREQIRNPHWIYPGQVIVLDRATGTMRLGAGPGANGTVKLSPQVRVETGRQAIPSISPEAIEPYLTQPLIVETHDMLEAPRIVAAKERVILGAGDIAYVAGITDPSVTVYQLYRPGRELKDPDTGKVIAYQADYVGTARITRPGDPATITITSSKIEARAGDRLVAATKPAVINYMPHAPADALRGRVVSTYADTRYAGSNMIVAVNRGAADGLDVGTILAIKTFGRTITDRTNGGREAITLPEERKGLLFVFRIFDHIAYGLITSTTDSVEVGDAVSQP